MSVAFASGDAAWHLKEPHWAWSDPPTEATVFESADRVSLAVCRLFPRQLQNDTLALKVVGIGGVYVRQDMRGYGVARDLLRVTLDALRLRGILAAILHARDGRLYRRLGFLEVHPGFWVKALQELDFYRMSGGMPWRVLPEGHF